MRLAVLGSTNGTDLVPIVEAIRKQRLMASVELIISNNEASGLSLIHISEPTRPY